MGQAFGLYTHCDNDIFRTVYCDYPDKEVIVIVPIHTSHKAL